MIELTIFATMKQAKLDDLRRVLKSAETTKHISKLIFDGADSSYTFKFQGDLYEIQWDNKEMMFEMVKYIDRKTFNRLGEVNGEKLAFLFYQP